VATETVAVWRNFGSGAFRGGDGVHGRGPATPMTRRPRFTGCRPSTSCSEPSGRRRGRPNAGISVDLDVLASRGHVDVVTDVRADLEHVGAVSAVTLARMTCDCNIHRIITSGKSQILDLGRSTRTVTDAQWRALVARDRHCTEPGCSAPPGWCEAHHLKHWADGGMSNLDNYTLK